jgi:hypothetical protein
MFAGKTVYMGLTKAITTYENSLLDFLFFRARVEFDGHHDATAE